MGAHTIFYGRRARPEGIFVYYLDIRKKITTEKIIKHIHLIRLLTAVQIKLPIYILYFFGRNINIILKIALYVSFVIQIIILSIGNGYGFINICL